MSMPENEAKGVQNNNIYVNIKPDGTAFKT
jgi:hypothetical protein